MLVGTGRERPMDERAVSFLNRYGRKVTVLDAKELGVDILGNHVCEYLSPLVFTGVLSIYSHKLADARCHSVDVRRYMWHVAYCWENTLKIVYQRIIMYINNTIF